MVFLVRLRIIDFMMSKNTDISIIVLTYNEELHIKRCIERLNLLTPNIYVIDSFSTDNTVTLAKSLGATVMQNTWVNYGNQFQWAIDNCPIDSKWIMRVDADEYSSPELIKEISNKLPLLDDSINGVLVNLGWNFSGKDIRYGGRYPVPLLRIWRNGKAHIEQRWMDEHLVLDDGKTVRFDGAHIDHNLNSIGWFIDKHNNYATREMVDIINQRHLLFEQDKSLTKNSTQHAKYKRFLKENIYNKLPIFVRPTLYFIYRYFFRLGFLDGVEGFAYHFMQGYWYRCLIDMKVREAEKILKQCSSTEEKVIKLSEITGFKL